MFAIQFPATQKTNCSRSETPRGAGGLGVLGIRSPAGGRAGFGVWKSGGLGILVAGRSERNCRGGGGNSGLAGGLGGQIFWHREIAETGASAAGRQGGWARVWRAWGPRRTQPGAATQQRRGGAPRGGRFALRRSCVAIVLTLPKLRPNEGGPSRERLAAPPTAPQPPGPRLSCERSPLAPPYLPSEAAGISKLTRCDPCAATGASL